MELLLALFLRCGAGAGAEGESVLPAETRECEERESVLPAEAREPSLKFMPMSSWTLASSALSCLLVARFALAAAATGTPAAARGGCAGVLRGVQCAGGMATCHSLQLPVPSIALRGGGDADLECTAEDVSGDGGVMLQRVADGTGCPCPPSAVFIFCHVRAWFLPPAGMAPPVPPPPPLARSSVAQSWLQAALARCLPILAPRVAISSPSDGDDVEGARLFFDSRTACATQTGGVPVNMLLSDAGSVLHSSLPLPALGMAIKKMRVGERARVRASSSYAFGNNATRPEVFQADWGCAGWLARDVPCNASVVLDVELLRFGEENVIRDAHGSILVTYLREWPQITDRVRTRSCSPMRRSWSAVRRGEGWRTAFSGGHVDRVEVILKFVAYNVTCLGGDGLLVDFSGRTAGLGVGSMEPPGGLELLSEGGVDAEAFTLTRENLGRFDGEGERDDVDGTETRGRSGMLFDDSEEDVPGASGTVREGPVRRGVVETAMGLEEDFSDRLARELVAENSTLTCGASATRSAQTASGFSRDMARKARDLLDDLPGLGQGIASGVGGGGTSVGHNAMGMFEYSELRGRLPQGLVSAIAHELKLGSLSRILLSGETGEGGGVLEYVVEVVDWNTFHEVDLDGEESVIVKKIGCADTKAACGRRAVSAVSPGPVVQDASLVTLTLSMRIVSAHGGGGAGRRGGPAQVLTKICESEKVFAVVGNGLLGEALDNAMCCSNTRQGQRVLIWLGRQAAATMGSALPHLPRPLADGEEVEVEVNVTKVREGWNLNLHEKLESVHVRREAGNRLFVEGRYQGPMLRPTLDHARSCPHMIPSTHSHGHACMHA